MDLLEGLNEQQKKAVETTKGALLVLAGAGSGKTKVLTHRIAYILDQKLAEPDEILALTFTNKAAGEMKERINFLLKSNNTDTKSISWCGTFHSICLRILKIEGEKIGLSKNFTIYDSSDSLDVVKEAMNKLMIDRKEINPHAVRATISSAKNQLVSSQDYKEHAEGYFQELVAKIFPKYQEILKDSQALDFDDLIMATVQMLENHPDIREKYKNMFKFIHIDEYQDTNFAQYRLIKLITNKNICVVGDDDQSIYAFRGADITNILSFEKDFPDAIIIKLEQNYRSTQNILDASYHVVRHNKERREKKLWTEKEGGDLLNIFHALDEVRESEWVADRVESLMQDGTNPKEIAILYRTNAQSRTVEEIFIKRNIPYEIVGGIRFYDRKEVKDILAYLRILANYQDELSLKRIINTPRRGIGEKSSLSLFETAKGMNLSPVELLLNNFKSIANKNISNFGEILSDIFKAINTYKLSEFVNFVIERSGYFDYLNDGSSEGQYRIENLKELISVSLRYDTLETKEALQSFLEDIALIEESQKKNLDEDVVTLMTVHASKGLEFEHIFIVGMEELLFPHSRSYSDPASMEEERRLAYVAITRGKKQVCITHTQTRKYFGKIQSNPISRFISTIPENLIKLESDLSFEDSTDDYFSHYFSDEETNNILPLSTQKGDRVKHEIFGIGTILDIDDSTIKIDFGGEKGIKELAIEYSRLEKC